MASRRWLWVVVTVLVLNAGLLSALLWPDSKSQAVSEPNHKMELRRQAPPLALRHEQQRKQESAPKVDAVARARVPVVSVPAAWKTDGVSAIDLVMQTKLIPSSSEARRLIKQGGLKINGEKVDDINASIKPENEMVLRMGKRKFAQLKVE